MTGTVGICCGTRKLLTLLLCLMVYLVIWEGYLQNKLYGVSYSCKLGEGMEYLNSLCYNYTMNTVSGSVCKPLCNLEIDIIRCLGGHGNKPHVIEAEWNGVKVVLKTDKPLSYFQEYLPPVMRRRKFNITTTELIHHMNRTIFTKHSLTIKSDLSLLAATYIARECDIGNDGFIGYDEAIICWQLGTTHEFVLLTLLQGNGALVDLYGTCGNLYAVQYAIADPFFVQLSSLPAAKTWQLRSKVVVAMLNMVEALETTPLGTLYVCNFDRTNIGLVQKMDRTLVAKVLDMDVAYFEDDVIQQVRHKAGRMCRRHSQCSRVYCSAKCNLQTRSCSGRLASSNLVSICRRFVKPTDILRQNLLVNPPNNYKDGIETVLADCSLLGNRHIDKKLLMNFKELLISSSELNIK